MNNDFENLRIVNSSIHALSHSALKESITKKCQVCGVEFDTFDGWRTTCGSKICAGKSAHINGHNKGNAFTKGDNAYKTNRHILDDIPTVKDLLQQ